MSKGKIDFNVLDEAFNSAPMSENKTENKVMKKKLISISQDWEDKIKKHFAGTLNSYITMAIYERMQKDGII
jgi:hypothetical protein